MSRTFIMALLIAATLAGCAQDNSKNSTKLERERFGREHYEEAVRSQLDQTLPIEFRGEPRIFSTGDKDDASLQALGIVYTPDRALMMGPSRPYEYLVTWRRVDGEWKLEKCSFLPHGGWSEAIR